MSNARKFQSMTDAGLEHIARETALRDAVEPRAASVRYDSQNEALILALKNGVVVLIPTQFLQGVKGADPKRIANVQTDARGYGIHFEELNADFSVPGLLAGIFGSEPWMNSLQASGEPGWIMSAAEMGHRGGSKSTRSKIEAARANGKRGGRPRKKVPA